MSKPLITYSDHQIPGMRGAIYNRDLKFPNPYYNKANICNDCAIKQEVSLKYIINPRNKPHIIGGNKSNSFGTFNSLWYPNMYIDLNYNTSTGGYINANGPMGPYFATSQGNYPRSMFKEVYFGERKTLKPKRKKSNKIIYCLPKEQKFPVNTKKRCSAALSHAIYAPSPCKIAECVKKNCKKYPTVGKSSKLMEKCEKKKKRKYTRRL